LLFRKVFSRGRKLTNELDETTGPINSAGRDVNVIDKQIKAEVGPGSKIFEIAFIIAASSNLSIGLAVVVSLLGVAPGLIFILMKVNALNYLRKLQQKIQADASQIDNYLENRVMILQNLAGLLAKSIDLDKDVMKTVAAYRGGVSPASDEDRNQASAELDGAFRRINVAFEAYPDLKAQENIADAMRQNSYLQREITAARTLYNDTVTMWNQEIFSWPTKQIVAAKAGYSTRIPFTASAETKAAARETFF
jgi:LemA protein